MKKHKTFVNDKEKEFLFVLILSLIFLTLLFFRTEKIVYSNPTFNQPWDHHKYIEMAKHPFGFHIAPYCWRIIVPLIAYILPFTLETNFLIITFISILITSILIYYLLKELNFNKNLALTGLMIFFSLGWATKYFIQDFWLVDSTAFLFIVIIIYFLLKRNDLAFSIFLLLGILVKETIFFTAPLYYSLNAKKFIDFKLLAKFTLLVLPAILISIFIRSIIPYLNYDHAYLTSLPDKLKIVFDNKSNYDLSIYFNFRQSIFGIIKNIFGTFGIILLLFPLFTIGKNFPLLIRFSPFLLAGFLQLLSPINVPRLLIICSPVLIIMALNGIKKLIEEKNYSFYFFIIIALLFYLSNLVNPSIPNLQFRYQLMIILSSFVIISSIRIIKRKHENRIIGKA
ncbi:MAG: hypothetical protein ACYC6P_11420 [Ignavibacteriaceae bacterium]